MKNNVHLVDVLHTKHDLVLWTRKKIMVAKKLIHLAQPILVAMDEAICQATAEFTD